MANCSCSVIPAKWANITNGSWNGSRSVYGPNNLRCPIRMDSPEHMVIGQQMVEAQILDRSPELSDGGRIPVKFGLGVGDADVHEAQFFMGSGVWKAEAKSAIRESGAWGGIQSADPDGCPSNEWTVRSGRCKSMKPVKPTDEEGIQCFARLHELPLSRRCRQ